MHTRTPEDRYMVQLNFWFHFWLHFFAHCRCHRLWPRMLHVHTCPWGYIQSACQVLCITSGWCMWWVCKMECHTVACRYVIWTVFTQCLIWGRSSISASRLQDTFLHIQCWWGLHDSEMPSLWRHIVQVMICGGAAWWGIWYDKDIIRNTLWVVWNVPGWEAEKQRNNSNIPNT